MPYKFEEYSPVKGGTFSALLYGGMGSGKTSLAVTFPNVLVIDSDRGLRGIAGKVNRVELEEPRGSYDKVMEVLRDAKKKQGNFAPDKPFAKTQTIVLDAMTSLVDEFFLPELMLDAPTTRKLEGPKFEEYAKLKMRLQAMASLVKDLARTMNVVLIAGTLVEKDEVTGKTYGRPNLTGSFRESIGYVPDEVYYLTSTEVNGTLRVDLYAAKRDIYEAKTRLLKVLHLENPSYALLQANLR